MQQLSNHPALNQALNKVFAHSLAVRNGEDSHEAAKRLFSSQPPVSSPDRSVCCKAPVISEGAHTWCDNCGEYANIVQDKPLAF